MARLHLGIFASGRGSNFKAILNAIQDGRLCADISVLISNNQDAGALQTADVHGIKTAVINKRDFGSRDDFIKNMIQVLRDSAVDFIALAGYMKKIPVEVIQQYQHRITNIHPALLPAFGGKGMYGHHVHEAVLAAGCKVSGVTVHLVDEEYDRGPIVAQRCVPVEPYDTPDLLAARVLQVEHQLYAEILQLFSEERILIDGNCVILKK